MTIIHNRSIHGTLDMSDRTSKADPLMLWASETE
jgi:hypothetical protein